MEKESNSSVDYILIFLSRIESHGQGILKPHQLLAEFEGISTEDKLKLEGGAFEEVLKSTQELWMERYCSTVSCDNFVLSFLHMGLMSYNWKNYKLSESMNKLYIVQAGNGLPIQVLERLVKIADEDNEKFFMKLADRIDRFFCYG